MNEKCKFLNLPCKEKGFKREICEELTSEDFENYESNVIKKIQLGNDGRSWGIFGSLLTFAQATQLNFPKEAEQKIKINKENSSVSGSTQVVFSITKDWRKRSREKKLCQQKIGGFQKNDSSSKIQKKQRNRISAQKSRRKKKAYIKTLESQVENLENELDRCKRVMAKFKNSYEFKLDMVLFSF
jgi:hypothetical protein